MMQISYDILLRYVPAMCSPHMHLQIALSLLTNGMNTSLMSELRFPRVPTERTSKEDVPSFRPLEIEEGSVWLVPHSSFRFAGRNTLQPLKGHDAKIYDSRSDNYTKKATAGNVLDCLGGVEQEVDGIHRHWI